MNEMNNNELNEIEKFKQFQEAEKRIIEEAEEFIDTVLPPADIMAFTEMRSCADILRMYNKNQIDIKPDFQRGEVWSTRAQTLFIDSLLKQLPIPSMCISLDPKTQKRLVIDGLQRISSIIHFLGNEDWQLANMPEVDERISGKKTSKIHQDYPEIFEMIENVSIPITVLRCDYDKPSHMNYLFQIFYRLNTGAIKLFNQEIRNCIYQGSLNNLLKELARTDDWYRFTNTDENKIDKARFSHEERILRFFAFYENYENYKGRFAGFLNDFMGGNKNANEEQIGKYRTLFQRTLNIAKKLTNINDSKNVVDAVLVGIARNIGTIENKDAAYVQECYNQLMQEDEFSALGLKGGLSSKEKVITRIRKSIQHFS